MTPCVAITVSLLHARTSSTSTALRQHAQLLDRLRLQVQAAHGGKTLSPCLSQALLPRWTPLLQNLPCRHPRGQLLIARLPQRCCQERLRVCGASAVPGLPPNLPTFQSSSRALPPFCQKGSGNSLSFNSASSTRTQSDPFIYVLLYCACSPPPFLPPFSAPSPLSISLSMHHFINTHLFARHFRHPASRLPGTSFKMEDLISARRGFRLMTHSRQCTDKQVRALMSVPPRPPPSVLIYIYTCLHACVDSTFPFRTCFRQCGSPPKSWLNCLHSIIPDTATNHPYAYCDVWPLTVAMAHLTGSG